MRPGLYALASLDEAPLPMADLEALGLGGCVTAPGLALRGADLQADALLCVRTMDGFAAFAGYLDEPAEAAGALGLPQSVSPLRLALAAVERFGAEASRHLLGQWSVLRWQARARRLTLAASETLRDCLYFASNGRRVAVAPSCMQLGALTWVGRVLDLEGLALNASRAGLRHIRTDETMWKGIRMLAPGTHQVFTLSRTVGTCMSPPGPAERWEGSFDELAEAFDTLGRRVVRQQMERYGRCAFHLSGGLDSTLMTAWGALERGAGREMFAVTSVAPPGSGLADELEFSAPAAAALGVELQQVWPEAEADLFRPAPARFRQMEGPSGGAYPVLEALSSAALAGGAAAAVGGWAGEMHVSNGFAAPETRTALRRWAAGMRDRLKARQAAGGWPASAFGVYFSDDVLQALPAGWAGVWSRGAPRARVPKAEEPIGVSPMAAKAAAAGSADPAGRLRIVAPYYDRRLVRLGARIPASFLQHGGQTRPLARALLRGRVPDAVRLRQRGRPFAPDFVPRLRAQAAQARARVPLFAEAGVGRWLDLGRLDASLMQVESSSGTADYGLLYTVQATSMLAEFLVWASSEGVRL